VDHPARLSDALEATLVVVRHGESEWVAEGRFQGRGDPPLSPLGERQADLVAARLADPTSGAPLPLPEGPPRCIWHSPLRRASATAERIGAAQRRPVPVRPLEALTELAQGSWEGLLHSEVAAGWPELLEGWRRDPMTAHAPGGESLSEAAARVDDALSRIVEALEPTGPRVPASSSPVLGYPAATRDEATPPVPPRPWAVAVAHDGVFRLLALRLLELPIARFWSLPFALCAITVIDLRGGRASLRAHNLAEHLAPLADEARAAAEARGDRRGAL
jgi:phosphoserine phosphatase